MRIGIDATSAALQHAGVGRYTRELLAALLKRSDDDAYVLACAAGETVCRALLDELPPGALRDVRKLPLPERYMTAAWQRAGVPVAVERFIGSVDVFHGPDFVLPPTRSPAVVTIHDLSYLVAPQYAEPSLARYLSVAVPRALQRAERVIAVSASVASEIATAYPFVRERLVAISNGARLPKIDTALDQAREPASVLFVGTIEPRKNIPTLLQAMRTVLAEIPEASLVVAGRIGWRAEAIVRELRELEAAGAVQFVEAPNDRELERLFQLATVFVYPSFYEGFGLPVIEAMARGLPVVTSDIPALRETGGSVARYVPACDSAALAAAIGELLGDARLRDDLNVAGRRRAELFSWDETALRTWRVYESVASVR